MAAQQDNKNGQSNPANFIDMKGQTFGFLEVQERAPSPPGPNVRSAWWFALCTACGSVKPYQGSSLRKREAKSCGCQRAAFVSAACKKWPPRNSPEYTAWKNMRKRCLDPKHPNFHQYGGRGITVCDEWKDDFSRFYRDLGKKPSPEHTLERKENNRGYEPGNVVWAMMEEQANNRRDNVLLTYRGRTQSASQWSREIGLSTGGMYYRLDKGWSMDRIVNTPADESKRRTKLHG